MSEDIGASPTTTPLAPMDLSHTAAALPLQPAGRPGADDIAQQGA